MNLRELNYILIPDSTEGFERFAGSRLGRAVIWLTTPLWSLTREGQIALFALLVAGAAGMDVRFSHLYLVFCGLFGLLFAAWLFRPFARLAQVRFEIERPPRVQAGQVVEFTGVVHNEGPRPVYGLRVRGPFLPWDGTWESQRPHVAELRPGETARVALSARFLLRGAREVGSFWLVSAWPLGLMAGRRVASAKVHFTVIPRVVPVDGLPVPPTAREPPDERGRALTAGESFELMGVRPYRPGDRIRDLHARSWARAGQPMVREYREAARRRVAVYLHPGMRKPNRDVFDAAVSVAASLVSWAVQQEALVDLVVPGDPPAVVTVGAHLAAVERALDALAPVTARAGLAQPVAEMAPGAFDRVGVGFLVFADWGPETAAIVARIRQLVPAQAILVSPSAATRASSAEAGVIAVDPKQVAERIRVA